MRENPIELTSFNSVAIVGSAIHKTTHSVYSCGLLNAEHPFVQWLILVKEACETQAHGLTKEHYARLLGLLRSPLLFRGHDLQKLKSYLERWQSLRDLPPELYPPSVDMNNDMFSWQKPTITKTRRHRSINGCFAIEDV